MADIKFPSHNEGNNNKSDISSIMLEDWIKKQLIKICNKKLDQLNINSSNRNISCVIDQRKIL